MRFPRTATALCLLAALSTGPAVADDKKAAAPTQPPMDEKAMMEMMQKLATPGPEHKALDVMAGKWAAKITMYMDPSKPPAVSEGTSDVTWILGGRFLLQTFEGQMMGQPFTGQGLTGYDNYKKRYVGTWTDTMTTTILTMNGTLDKAGKVLSMSGKMDDFTTGKTSTIRYKTTVVNKDTINWEMWGPGPDGKDFKMMTIVYNRKT
jgi:hypothetical protein